LPAHARTSACTTCTRIPSSCSHQLSDTPAIATHAAKHCTALAHLAHTWKRLRSTLEGLLASTCVHNSLHHMCPIAPTPPPRKPSLSQAEYTPDIATPTAEHHTAFAHLAHDWKHLRSTLAGLLSRKCTHISLHNIPTVPPDLMCPQPPPPTPPSHQAGGTSPHTPQSTARLART
jgi:hypothetical protein